MTVFTPETDGTFTVHLSDDERAILAAAPAEVLDLLADRDNDASTFRLFPRAYEEDLGRQIDYDRLMRDDLLNRHIVALKDLAETIRSTRITITELDTWARAINLVRLVLGTRLDVTESSTERDFPRNSPLANAFALYAYLGDLQEDAVDALAQSLPPPSS